MQGHVCSHHTSRTVSCARPDPLARVYVASIGPSHQGKRRDCRYSGQHGVYFVDLLCVIPSEFVYYYIITEMDAPVTSIANIVFFVLPVSRMLSGYQFPDTDMFYQLQDGWNGLLAT